MFSWIANHWPELLAALWALDRLADIVARLTPTKKDDAIVAKFHSLLVKLASLGIKPRIKA